MQNEAEKAVLRFLKNLNLPGIRYGEGNKEVCDYLKSNGYKFTPDLVAGPEDIKEAPIEGLFFIEVIKPTSDLLFQSEFFKDLSFNTPQYFKDLLSKNANNDVDTYIDMLPNSHHDCYLDKYNGKLDKYSHQRNFIRDGQVKVTTNFGIVHHFNLGKVEGNNISDAKGLITLLDYFRFYKRLAPSNNIDLKNLEARLLRMLLNDAQNSPFILIVGRTLESLPCLFQILHVCVEKQNAIYDLSIMILNTSILDNADGNHPVHKWLASKILDPRSKKYLNDDTPNEKFQIAINPKLFS